MADKALTDRAEREMAPLWTSADVTVNWHGRIAVLVLHRAPVNALSAAFRQQIGAALGVVASSGAQGLVVTGTGTGTGAAFVAGADIAELGQTHEPALRDLIAMLQALPIPTVAAINGLALGGGLELALGCNRRLAAPEARMGFPEVSLGLLPGAGGTVHATILCGALVALDLVTSGRQIPAQEALQLGLIDAIAPGDLLQAAILACAEPVRPPLSAQAAGPFDRVAFDRTAFDRTATDIAARSKGEAVKRCISAVEYAATHGFAAAMAHERALFVAACASPESLALRHLFFAERTAAKVAGITPASARPLALVGVVGAGLMGRGIAMACADAGLQVRLRDVAPGAIDRALATIADQYRGMAAKGRLTDSEATARTARILAAPLATDLAGCDLIIEAAFEDMAVKQAIFAELDQTLGPDVILATNTSYLDVNLIAQTVRRPERVIGLHFFSPANIMKLLEIVRGSATDVQTLATGMALARRLRKVSVVVGVCRGFVGNRMLQARNAPLAALLLEGASPETVDAAFRDFGWPMGPFQMQDMAGLDISWRNRQSLGLVDAVADALCAAGRLGQKAGRGWYSYEAGSRTPQPDPEVARLILDTARQRGITQRRITPPEIIARTHRALIAEGHKILAEGIAARASDIDVVWVQGYGFPRHLGGPMFWAASAPSALE